MAKTYTKNTWVDEVLAGPETYNISGVGAGQTIALDQSVTQAGSPVSASRMNNIEDGIDVLDTKLAWMEPYPLRNLLINGDMKVSQRGTSEAGITSGYAYRKAPDRWKHGVNLAGTWTALQVATPLLSTGKSYKLSCTVASGALAAAAYHFLDQQIEGQLLQHVKKGAADAEDLTISFAVKSSVTGTYIVELLDAANGRSISKAYTVSAVDTWENKAVTFPGDTVGTIADDNTAGLRVLFWMAAGSNFSSGSLQSAWGASVTANRAVGQVNVGATVGNSFSLGKAQLEVGDTVTEFEHVPYDVQYLRCRRYCKRLANTVMPGQAYNTTVAGVIYQFDIAMRVAPTLTVNTNGFLYNASGSAQAVSTWVVSLATDLSVRLNGTLGAAALTAGHATSATGQDLVLEADL